MIWCRFDDLVGAEVTQVLFDYAVSFAFQDVGGEYHLLRIEGDFRVDGPVGPLSVRSDVHPTVDSSRSELVRLFGDVVDRFEYSRTDELRIAFGSGNQLVCPGSQGFEAWLI